MVTHATRRWMREFAALRQEAAKVRSRDGAAGPERDLLDRALQLADAIREDLAACHQRCLLLEDEVRAADARMDAVFESLPMAVVTTDLQGVIQSGNRAAGILLGRSHSLKDQLLLHYAEDRPGFADLLQRARASADTVTSRIRMRPRERAVIDVSIAALLDARDTAQRTLLWFLRAEGVPPGPAVALRAPSARRRSTPLNQPRL
jgi:PAS domain-containing protein